MNTRNLRTMIAFGGGVALVACTSTVEVDTLASSDSFCTAKAEAECNNLKIKCNVEGSVCAKARANVCNTAGAQAANQGRSYRAGAAQACIDSINSTYKNGGNDATPESEAETAKVCERVFSGAKKESDLCTNAFECEGALTCDKGLCVKEDKVALRAQCNNAGQVCQTGAYCQPQGGTKICVEKGKLDEACNDGAPCGETLRCVSFRCVPRVAPDNFCDNDGECAPAAPYCDATDKKCKPKYESSSAACQAYRL